MIRHNKTTLEVSIPSQLGYEKIVRETMASLGRQLGLNDERIYDLQTAVCEACINAIEHGNQCQPELRISILCTVTRDHLDVVVVDQGVRACPTHQPPPASIDQRIAGLASPRGMGLTLISQLVDDSGFLPTKRRAGNRFWLRMFRRKREESLSSSVGA